MIGRFLRLFGGKGFEVFLRLMLCLLMFFGGFTLSHSFRDCVDISQHQLTTKLQFRMLRPPFEKHPKPVTFGVMSHD